MANFSDGIMSGDAAVLSEGEALASAGNMRKYLQTLLDSKEKQVQQAGTLGQRLLSQHAELEELVRQLQDIDGDKSEDAEISAELRLRYRDLVNTLDNWEEENKQLSNAFAIKHQENGLQPSPALPTSELPSDTPVSGPSASAASQSRRARNAQHRPNDVEFAFEIGSSLLTEVRRLQSLLGERDKAIQDMKEEKDDLEKAVENLRVALKTQEQNADKFKEENWNLEVTLQELRTQLTDAQSSAQRGEAETKRLTKVLASTRESNDSYKNEVERLKATIEEAKVKHETDMALHRKHAAQLTRDKSDLQQSIDSYKLELQRANRRMPRFGSPMTPEAHGGDDRLKVHDFDEDDPFGAPSAAASMRRRQDTSALFPPDVFAPESVDNSPDPSPSRPFLAPNHPSNEIEALQQKLAHAQRQISTLKGTLGREKELRIDYKRRLNEAGLGVSERLDDDEDQEEAEVDEQGRAKVRARATPFTRRGRGRGISSAVRTNGRGNLASRLGAVRPSEFEDDDLAPFEEDDSAPFEPDQFPSTYLPETDMQIPEDSGEMHESELMSPQSPPSEFPADTSRMSVASIDGMDPIFANVLKRANSNASIHRDSSPVVRGSMRNRGTVGRRRGGTAFQEARPSSIVGAPEALAAELGLGFGVGMESVAEDEVPERELAESACQTEPEELPVPVVVEAPPPVTIVPEKADMGIQVDPEPIPEPTPEPLPELSAPVLPSVVKADASMQTDAALHVDASASTEPEIVRNYADGDTMTETHLLVPTSEAETQTPRLKTMEIDTQTPPESPKPKAIMAEMEIQTMPEVEEKVRDVTLRPQTPPRNFSEVEIQTTPKAEVFEDRPRRISLGGPGYARLRYLSSASTVTGFPRASMRQVIDDNEDMDDARTELAYAQAEETEPETETDMEDYHDARSALAPTPSASDSVHTFHSMSTMTDNEFSDQDSDLESIKASVMNMGGRASRMSRTSSMVHSDEEPSPSKPPVTYEEAVVVTDPLPEEPKRQLSDMSIQTDEWKPEPVAVPVPLKGFGLYKVGPSSQPFQFVSPPPSAPATSTTMPISPVTSLSTSASIKDSQATIGARPIRFSSPSLPGDVDRRKSIDSALSSSEFGQRQHTQSLGPSMSPVVDKTRPPTMMLPPPPKMPPPPNSMPPPSFIPEKRRPTSSLSSHRDMPPPRPSSPPPPELIQRATTPTFGAALTVPGRGMGSMRQHGSSLPPMAGLRQPPSTLSFRSAANAAAHAGNGLGPSALLDSRDRHLRSSTSLLSDPEDIASRRSSVSSDFHMRVPSNAEQAMNNPPETPNRAANMSGSTDPVIIHAITQTMIGEFLYKYTRRPIGKGHGERRHKRFFWVHPYTRTLYWSSADPGSTNVTEQSAKSAYINSVRAVLDPNPMPPGLHQYSVVISTPQREMKITAPTKERHEIWLNALQYLLARPEPNVQSPANQGGPAPHTPMRMGSANGNGPSQGVVISPKSQRSGRSEQSGMSGDSAWNITPRGGRRSRSRVSMGPPGSVGKRSGTPAAEYLRWADGPGSPGGQSLHGFEQIGHGLDVDDDDLDFEIHDSMTSDQEGFEGLENVRACCDGRHTVGRSGYDHHHHHHHHHHHPQPGEQRLPPQFLRQDSGLAAEHLQPSRPVSPAFSFRSRASSTKSQGGGVGSLFSRFGTRRSKTAPSMEG